MIRSLSVIAAGVIVLGAGAALAEGDGMPEGAGHDTFVRVCSACHAPDLVMDKRMDRAGWDELVQTMIGRGAAATDAEAKEIIDYLYASFPDGSAAAAPAAAAAAAPAAATTTP